MGKTSLFVVLGTLVGGGAVQAAACYSATCEDYKNCQATDNADVDAAPVCDPENAPANMTEDYGVFVDGDNGTDSADAGSQANPFKSITYALDNLGGKSSVFICGSKNAYDEKVELSTNTSLSLYGGLECGTWNYTCAATRIAPSGPVVALRITSVPSSVTVTDLTFEAMDGATTANLSSIAIFVSNSPSVTLQRVTAIAGKGKGADPAGTQEVGQKVTDEGGATLVVPDGIKGSSTDNTDGGATKTCYCGNRSSWSTGGAGGDGNKPGDGGNGEANPADGLLAITAPVLDGKGGVYSDADGCHSGHSGANAGTPGQGGPGATTYGTLTDAVWMPANGDAGTNGYPGQGGGGGSGGLGGGGGGGGCGGCGGLGGAVGPGGGGSIAIASYQSGLHLVSCTLLAKDAGNGGHGGGGGVNGVAPDCPGGGGGGGSGGGGGGGGAGGISVGVLYVGSAPDLSSGDNHITYGAAGAAGAAGGGGGGGRYLVGALQDYVAVSGDPGGEGQAGVSAETLEVSP